MNNPYKIIDSSDNQIAKPMYEKSEYAYRSPSNRSPSNQYSNTPGNDMAKPFYKRNQYNKPQYNQQQKPNYGQQYKQMNQQPPTTTANISIYPPPRQPKQSIAATLSPYSPYLPFGMQNSNPGGFPQMYDPYNTQINPQQYNIGGEHAIPIGFVKNYNIFANNIQDYNTRILPIIYEDSIPLRGGKHELTTLSERILLYEYVKNNLVSYEEGEEGCMNENGGINLMRQLKYLSPHPINYNILYTNPLRGLAKGLRIYKTCYPITVDNSNKTMCLKNSVGIHIRFYSNEHFNINRQHSNTNRGVIIKSSNTNTHRELTWYKWIRNNILLKRVCPNFIMMYAYYTCLNCSEQFQEVDRTTMVRPMAQPFTLHVKPQEFVKLASNNKGKSCMVVLTEAPNMNILEWMTNERTYKLNKRQQTNWGYHNEEVWRSIYFQLLAALYVLYKNDVYIEDFGYENIWIKEIPQVGHWEYIIGGIKYYVPNAGYLVLIDTSFRDIFPLESDVSTKKNRIKSNNLFGDEEGSGKDYVKKSMLEKVFCDDPFGRGLINASVRLPPRTILDMVSKCGKDIKTKIYIEPLFYNHMNYYLHSKISNLVETKMIGELIEDISKISSDELVCYTDPTTGHKIATIVINSHTDGQQSIVTRSNNNIIKLIRVYNGELEKILDQTSQNNNIFEYINVDLNNQPLAVYNLD